MRAFLIGLTLVASLVITSSAAPVRPDSYRVPTTPPPIAVPDLRGPWNWGELTQFDRTIQIKGSPVWEAVGVIRKDGKVQLLWTKKASGEPCPAVYAIKEGKLVGHYGYSGQAWVGESGELEGNILSETLFRVER